MRLTMILTLVLTIAVGAFAQSTTATTTTVYDHSYRVLDSVGNLVVFDFGFSYSSATSRLLRTPRDPKTRITIVRPAGAPETREYTGAFTFVGVGAKAVYAIVTTTSTSGTTTNTSNRLVALNPQLSLPATIAAFNGTALPTTRFDVDMGQPDTISILTEAVRTSTTAVTPRTVKVVKFNGGTFDMISSATLP